MLLVSENIQFLLWQRGIKRSAWIKQLALWLGCDVNRSEDLLWGTELQPSELDLLSQMAGIAADQLVGTRLVVNSEIDILASNIQYLTKDLGYGRLKELAGRLGLHPTTIAKWRRGEARPRKAHLEALYRYFGLPIGTNLEDEPIFLSLSPVGDQHMRIWLQEHIAMLDSVTMRRLFPALERLLKKPIM